MRGGEEAIGVKFNRNGDNVGAAGYLVVRGWGKLVFVGFGLGGKRQTSSSQNTSCQGQ
jgi:hypothetical protein